MIDNLLFISAQPFDFYFVWQVECQIVNFRKFDISSKMHVLVWYPDNELRKAQGKPLREDIDLKHWLELAKKYPEVHFYFYQDRGVNLDLYIPQLRPHILSRHFQKFPELVNSCVFYHDSDIIFNTLPEFEYLCEGPTNWESDTSGYLDYDYLRRKEIEGNLPEHEAIGTLCKTGNISIDTMKMYAGMTGGAQYLLKGIDASFWEDVERQVLEIRTAFFHNIEGSINQKYFPNENSGFQSWCADMWAVNMALWSRGKETNITPQLDFSWATDSAETYFKKPIFHNAGATGAQPGVFYKAKWMTKSPLGINHSLNPATASYYYGLAMQEVK